MKRIVVVADTQVGSNFSVMPESAYVAEGNHYIDPNPLQRALLKAYIECAREWRNPDILVLNGDLIEGKQPRNRGVEVWTTNLMDQVKAATELVKMWNAKKIFVVRGTAYHVQIEGEPVEEILAEKVGAEKAGIWNKSGYELFMNVDGVTFSFAHHVESSKVFQYRATAITREMALAMLNATHKWPADIVVRSHVHYFWHSESASHHSFITPCWQAQTPYMVKLSASGAIPDIGALQFTVDEGVFSYEKKLYSLPELKPPMVKA